MPRHIGEPSRGPTRPERPWSRPCPPHAAIVCAPAFVMTRSTSSLAGPTASGAVRRFRGLVSRKAKRLTITSPVCPAAVDREMQRSNVGRCRSSVSPVAGLSSTHIAVVARSAFPHHRPNAYRNTMFGEYKYLSGRSSGDEPTSSISPWSAASRAKVSVTARSWQPQRPQGLRVTEGRGAGVRTWRSVYPAVGSERG